MFDYDPQKHYPKETESRVVIRFQDCDPLRHLNNAKYFDYFFNAREDQVPKLYGLEIIDMIREYKAAWVVYNHNISYIRPAAAIFSNYLGIKRKLEEIPGGFQVTIDLKNTKLVDHSVMENLHRFQESYEDTGGTVKIIGLENHTPVSDHPLAAQKSKS